MTLSGSVTIPNEVAFVYDVADGMIYAATSDGYIVKWNPLTQSVVGSVKVAQKLTHLAISPDGSFVMATEDGATAGSVTIHRVYTASLADSDITVAVGSGSGVTGIALTADGQALISAGGASPVYSFSASGVGPVKASPVSGLNFYSNFDNVIVSNDFRYAIIEDPSISDGPIALYDSKTSSIVGTTDYYALGSSGFGNDEEVISDKAGLIAYMDYNNAIIIDTSLKVVKNFGSGYGISGAQFSLDGSQFYLWNYSNAQIQIYDTRNWAMTATVAVPQVNDIHANGAAWGRMLVGDGGKLLFLQMPGSIYTLDLAAALGQKINGTALNDYLVGGPGDDVISGGNGDDLLVGGGGDDTIDGGPGYDVASYSGARSDYAITVSIQGGVSIYRITDLRPNSPDGSDVVRNVEAFHFSGGAVTVANLAARPVGGVAVSGVAPQTDTQVYAPDGALLAEQLITINGSATVTSYFDGQHNQFAANIVTDLGNGSSQSQQFDGAWNQQQATLIQNLGGGGTLVEQFTGAWSFTGAVRTQIAGGSTVVQTFDSAWNQVSATVSSSPYTGATLKQSFDNHWNQLSATLVRANADGSTETQIFGGGWDQTSAVLVTPMSDGTLETQTFDGNWVQTSATLKRSNPDGSVQTQTFDGNWVQTGAFLVSHPDSATTVTQTFGANWTQSSAEIVTVNGPTTLDRQFDGHWKLLGGNVTSQIDANTQSVQVYDAAWQTSAPLEWLVHGQGAIESFVSVQGAVSEYIFSPGQINGDAFSGFVTAAAAPAAHDVLQFVGYGAGAHLTQLDASHWEVTAPNHAAEVFTLAGTLQAGVDAIFT